MRSSQAVLSTLLCASGLTSAKFLFANSYSEAVYSFNYDWSSSSSSAASSNGSAPGHPNLGAATNGSALAQPFPVALTNGSEKAPVRRLKGRSAERSAMAAAAVQQLQPIAVSKHCWDNPSWLTFDYAGGLVYCLNEGLNTPNGSLASLKVEADGTLVELDLVVTLGGPVSAVLYGPNRNGLALAHYATSSVSVYNVENPAHLEIIEEFTFKLTEPGANPDRQEAPHPHEATLDPTGKWICVPDLGADLIRVWGYDEETLHLIEHDAVTVTAGYGPRHMAWNVKGDKTYAYVVTELTSRILIYVVTYPGGNIEFELISDITIRGGDTPIPSTVFAAEIVVSPDGEFVIVSSRGDNSTTIPNFDPSNSEQIVSDTIITFSIDGDSGELTLVQNFPAGGSFPRHFSITEDGTIVVVGLQNDGRVVLIERDVETGLLVEFIAYANVDGQAVFTAFFEKEVSS